MSKRTRKLTVAGAIVACAFGGVALRFAVATPGVGISTTVLSGPVVLDEAHVITQHPEWGAMFKTRGFSDVYVVRNVIAPGGHTGWHSHPGPSIISVVSGQATEYRSDESVGIVQPAGTAFVDEGGDHKHILVNEGSTDLVLVAFQVLPLGAPRRIDEPAP